MGRIIAPADPARTEQIGVVEDIVYTSEDGTYAILRLNDGLTVCGPVGDGEGEFERGQRFRWLGRWQLDPKYGYRFRWTTFVADTPLTRAGTIKYLASICDGIGQKRAAQLWDKYGPDTLAVVRQTPERTVSDRILSQEIAEEAAQKLIDNQTIERTKVDLFGLLSGRGFPGTLINRVISKWGAKSPEMIRRNPYSMMISRLPGAGFVRCDKLYLDLGKPVNKLKRQAILTWQTCRNEGTGSTWMLAMHCGLHLKSKIPEADPVRALRLAVRANLCTARRDDQGRVWIADRRRAINEQRVADAIQRLSLAQSIWTQAIPVSQEEGDGLPSIHQSQQAALATRGAVGILCGSPGTGKTHTLRFLLESVIGSQIGIVDVAVCAPTGKAAVRATQSLKELKIRATTIHSLLRIQRNGHDGDWGFLYNRDNPLPYRVVVMDESSMVDVDLLADLLDACAVGTMVLLIGDPHQLPPVGHGRPFADLIAAKLPTGELTQVRRNAGMIVCACLRIKNGERFETASDYDAAMGRNLRLIEVDKPEKALTVLERLLTGMVPFHPVTETQVLVATNESSLLSRKNVNERLQKLLNPGGKTLHGVPWAVDDKVICLNNAFLSVVELPPACHPESSADAYGKKGVEQYVANGEIGYVISIGPRFCVVRFGQADSPLCMVPMAKPKQEEDQSEGGDKDDFALAYAITTHKSQGSESPCIVILADDTAGRICSREWIYTAVSRASKLCIIIGRKETLLKQSQRVTLSERKTFLKELCNARES